MNKYWSIALVCMVSLPLFAQQDSVYTREGDMNLSTVITRDVQTHVELTNKFNTTPFIIEDTIKPHEVHHTEYIHSVSSSYTSNMIASQRMRFGTQKQYPGYIRLGVGHANTDFAFRFNMGDQKRGYLRLFANHEAEWGKRMDEHSNLGLEYEKPLDKISLYFGAVGGHQAYTHYGRYFDSIASKEMLSIERFSDLKKSDIQNIWDVNAVVGLRSRNEDLVRYNAEVKYHLYNVAGFANEHQVHTTLAVDLKKDAHHCGANIRIVNSISQTDSIQKESFSPRHAIRIEPYYEYKAIIGSRQKRALNFHIGLNLDMNVGRGSNTTVKDLYVAPSPNVMMDVDIAPKMLTFYAQAKGSLGLGNMQSFVEGMPHRTMIFGVTSKHTAPYTPVDAEAGFHILPCSGLLLNVHGGFAYQKDQRSDIAVLKSGLHYIGTPFDVEIPVGDFYYVYSDYTRGKVGADLHYHYQDFVKIHAYGDYYFWKNISHETEKKNVLPDGTVEKLDINTEYGTTVITDGQVYDRASWEVGLRVDGRIDENWSLYSDNRFVGKRTVATTDGDKELKPLIDLSLGCKYEMKLGKDAENYSANNLEVFLQLNNYIHRANDIYYGYQTQGVHFLMGVAYRF